MARLIDLSFLNNLLVIEEEEEKKEYNILHYEPTALQLEWVDWAYKEGGPSVKLLLTARGYGKTDLIAIYGVVKKLEEDPDLTFIIMSRTAFKSRMIVSTIGQILQKRGHQGDFSKTEINLKNRKNIKKQPSVVSLSMTTSLKQHHCDYLILDDPLDPEDERSNVWKLRAFQRYQETGAIAKRIIVTGQYVAEDDLYTFLEKQEGVDKKSYWHGSIPFLDANLNDFRKEGKSERWIAKNYLGYFIIDESTPFANVVIGDYKGDYLYACLDPANKGDYSALVFLQDFGDFFAIRGYMLKGWWQPLIESKREELLKVDRFYYEENLIGPDGYFYFSKFFKSKTKAFGFYTTKNKVEKIMKMELPIKEKKIRIDLNSDPEFINNVKRWSPRGGASQYDDGVDALAMMLENY